MLAGVAPPLLEFGDIEQVLMLKSNSVVSFRERSYLFDWLKRQWKPPRRDKAEVLVVVNAMGTGKTAAMKRIATSSCHAIISEARRSGRLMVQDCHNLIDALGSDEERCVECFWQLCIAAHATRLFAGYTVDGIVFEDVPVAALLSNTRTFPHKHWVRSILGKPLDAALSELKRITGTVCASDAEPVFILDSVEKLSGAVSSRFSNTAQAYHTLLTRLLAALEPWHFCMVSGLSDGKIEKLCEYSSFVPYHGGQYLTMLSLKATLETFNDFYPNLQLTEARRQNLENFYVVTHGNPWLNRMAIDELARSKLFSTAVDLWESDVREYYRNRRDSSLLLTVEERARACVATVAGWGVRTLAEHIPGTTVPWSAAVEDSIVFAGQKDDTIVFSLPPFIARSWDDTDKVFAAVRNLVPGVNWDRILFDILTWFELDQLRSKKKLADLFEELVLSLFVMKFHVFCWAHSLDVMAWVPFGLIYPTSCPVLNTFKVCLKDGLLRPSRQMFTNSPLCYAAVHNVNSSAAHHDGFLPFTIDDTEPQWMAVGIRYGHPKSGSALSATTRSGSAQVFVTKQKTDPVPFYLSVCNEHVDTDTAPLFSQPDLAKAVEEGRFRQISGRGFNSRQVEVMHAFKLAMK